MLEISLGLTLWLLLGLPSLPMVLLEPLGPSQPLGSSEVTLLLSKLMRDTLGSVILSEVHWVLQALPRVRVCWMNGDLSFWFILDG